MFWYSPDNCVHRLSILEKHQGGYGHNPILSGCLGIIIDIHPTKLDLAAILLRQFLNDGEPVSLGDLRGNPVVLNFWATWCRPCVLEMPLLEEVYQEYSDRGLIVLAVNVRESSSRVEEFVQSKELSFPVVLDTGGVVTQQYGTRYYPTTFFIDEDGIIQEKKRGAFFSKAEIEEKLTKIMP